MKRKNPEFRSACLPENPNCKARITGEIGTIYRFIQPEKDSAERGDDPCAGDSLKILSQALALACALFALVWGFALLNAMIR